MFYIEILTIICFFGETKDSNHYLFEGMVSRGRTFYATILTSKQQFTGEEEIGVSSTNGSDSR